jgi:hypothetical protein
LSSPFDEEDAAALGEAEFAAGLEPPLHAVSTSNKATQPAQAFVRLIAV